MTMLRKPEIVWRNYWRCAPARDRTTPYGFAYGRTALKYGIPLLKLPPGSTVLCPDYICFSPVDVLTDAGLRVAYYPVTARLAPDWDALAGCMEPSIRAVLVVHFFGIPQDMARWRALADARGWRLIEDNAHGYGGLLDGRPLGTFGDIGIASPNKLLPIRNGGLLYVPSELTFHPPSLPTQPVCAVCQGVKGALRRAISRVPGLAPRLRPCPPYDSQAAFRGGVLRDWAMDAWSRAYLETLDLAGVRAARQALFRVWRMWTAAAGLEPIVAECPEECMPFVFAARAASDEIPPRWFAWGHRQAIDVHSWPTLPESLVRENGNAMRLWRRTICFPLPHDVSAPHLQRRLARLRAP